MELRTLEQIKKDFILEKELAKKLRNSKKEERIDLYKSVYDEYFSKSSHRFYSEEKNIHRKRVAWQMNLLKKFFKKENVNFLEIGCGNCELSIEVSKFVKNVFALDVFQQKEKKKFPTNFKFISYNGIDIPVLDKSVDIVYSHQVLEHIHPDDIDRHFKEVFRILKPKGIYICITPNFLSGPHDDSKYFNFRIAQGFHLKEYTTNELFYLLKKNNFSKIGYYIGGRGFYLKFPISLIKFFENLLKIFNIPIFRKMYKTIIFKAILGINIIGRK